MDIVKGSVVRAKAGRDRGGYFVVLDFDGRFAYIADGKRRKVEAPKKKNPLHLEPTHVILDIQNIHNRDVKKLLKEFKSI